MSDATGDTGEIARTLGAANIAYINGGVPSDKTTRFLASHAQRVALANYCSNVIIQMGINDLTAGTSDASLRGFIVQVANLFPSSGVFLSTIALDTSSTDNWQTAGNQTATANLSLGGGPRETHNDWRRTVPAGFAGCFEVADQVESGRNTGLWRVNGSANYETVDGVHESPAAYAQIATSGGINTSLITR